MATRARKIYQIGWGGQGQAWAPCLREAGEEVIVVLRHHSPSWDEVGQNLDIEKLSANFIKGDVVTLLAPDRAIPKIYAQHIAPFDGDLSIVLACGYPIWSREIELRPQHQALMFAPKAIGPELRNEAISAQSTHHLKTAVLPGTKDNEVISILASAMKFAQDNLIEATFEQEAVGDLISEQLLLCGGVFTLLELTEKFMREQKIPEALIQEECYSELVLIARMLRSKGLQGTFKAISDSAKNGAVVMKRELQAWDIEKILRHRVNQIVTKNFVAENNSELILNSERSISS